MIKLKLGCDASYEIKPTIFPDKTSQVWKIDDWRLETNPRFAKIEWYWEGNESELIWINQLICLLYQLDIEIDELYIPYLPYGRQDKEVSNDTTFAKQVFLEMLLKEHVGKVSTLDAHSYHKAIESYTVDDVVAHNVVSRGYDCIVYPDKGASTRYGIYSKYKIVLDKVRNQLTGEITGLRINKELSNCPKDYDGKMLIVDDLSDFGGTFKKATQFLKPNFPNASVSLYVTHFLGHGGIESYFESGINRIYTTDSLQAYWGKWNIDVSNVVIV